MRFHATEIKYEEVTVLGKTMLFTGKRIDRSTVPEGLYLYEVRHDDDCTGDPCEIADWIMVNHWGTLISASPIEMEWNEYLEKSYRYIDSETDWNYKGITSTLGEYIKKQR